MYLARRIVRMRWRIFRWPIRTRWRFAWRRATRWTLWTARGGLVLAHAAVYLAIAPKSNALYKAYGAVKRDVEETAADPVPLHLRNAPTRLMKELGMGGLQVRARLRGKSYGHGVSAGELEGRQWYFPTEEGVERGFGKAGEPEGGEGEDAGVGNGRGIQSLLLVAVSIGS